MGLLINSFRGRKRRGEPARPTLSLLGAARTRNENLGRDPGFDRRLLLLLKGRAEGENEEEENLLK